MFDHFMYGPSPEETDSADPPSKGSAYETPRQVKPVSQWQRPDSLSNEQAYDARQTSWQQPDWQEGNRPGQAVGQPPTPAGSTESILPNQIARQDAELFGQQQGRSFQYNQLRQPQQPGFGSNDIRLIPKTATERVIELNAQVESLQMQISQHQETIANLKSHKANMLVSNQQLQNQVNGLEEQIGTMRQEAITADRKYAEITKRIQIFSASRQKQLADLSALVDQLERQLRERNNPSPATNASQSQNVQGQRGQR